MSQEIPQLHSWHVGRLNRKDGDTRGAVVSTGPELRRREYVTDKALEFSRTHDDQQAQSSASPGAQSERDQPRMTIVLLNWNGWQDTLE